VRSALSQMDVPTRSSYVMAIVSPAERPAAASITSVPRSLASAVSPLLTGYMLGVSSFLTSMHCSFWRKKLYPSQLTPSKVISMTGETCLSKTGSSMTQA
jgi:hypothetical protein